MHMEEPFTAITLHRFRAERSLAPSQGAAVSFLPWAPFRTVNAETDLVCQIGNHLLLRDHIFVARYQNLANMVRH